MNINEAIMIFLGGAFAMLALVFVVSLMTGPRPPDELRFTLRTTSLFITASNINMELKKSQFTDGSISAKVTPTTEAGTPEQVQAGTINYASSNENVATVEEDPDDETKAKIKWVGEGEVDITANADADRGDGVRNITGSIHLTLVADEADKLLIELVDVPDPE